MTQAVRLFQTPTDLTYGTGESPLSGGIMVAVITAADLEMRMISPTEEKKPERSKHFFRSAQGQKALEAGLRSGESLVS